LQFEAEKYTQASAPGTRAQIDPTTGMGRPTRQALCENGQKDKLIEIARNLEMDPTTSAAPDAAKHFLDQGKPRSRRRYARMDFGDRRARRDVNASFSKRWPGLTARPTRRAQKIFGL